MSIMQRRLREVREGALTLTVEATALFLSSCFLYNTDHAPATVDPIKATAITHVVLSSSPSALKSML